MNVSLRPMIPGLSLLFAILLFVNAVQAEEKASATPPDFTKVDLKELGIVLVEPKKQESSGFVIGGKNDTKIFRSIKELNGKSIAELEKEMRPGASSTAGFLGAEESLLTILEEDNQFVVDERKVTHQEIALHLHVLGALGQKYPEQEFLYHGQRFKVKVNLSRGFQDSPFGDGTKTNAYANVENVTNGNKISYSLLVPHMIERYGFYEGNGTEYRLNPEYVLVVLTFLKK